MADELAKLIVKIGADFSELESALGSLGAKVNPAIQRTSSALTGAGRMLTAGLTVPIVGMAAASVKASVDFESAFAFVRKSVAATEPEFAQLRQGIRDMAKEMPASASAIAEVAGEAGQLGVASQDLLKFTEVAIKLGATTNMSASEAGKGLIRLANIMQLPTDAASHLGDELVHLGNNGASTEAEIMSMSLRIAGAGKIIGLSADEVMAFANAASSAGLRAEQGGSAISRTFVDIANAVRGIEPAKEELDKVKAAQQDVSDAAHAMEQAERGVRDASESVATAQRGVRDAHEAVATAARGVRDATDAVASAQRGLRDSGEAVTQAQRGVRDSQEALAGAHRTAQLATQTLSEAYVNLARAQRDQRQASLDSRRETLSVAEAMQGLREVQAQAGGQSLALKDAQMALAQAQAASSAAAKKGGLEQSAAALAVEQAQFRLQQVIAQGPRYNLDLQNANLRLEEAQNRLGQSAERQSDNMYNANKNVANSIAAVNDARKGERNAAEGVNDSQKNLRNSYEGVQTAQKNLQKSIEGVQEAQKQLRNANEGVDGANKNLRNSNEGVKDAQYNAAKSAQTYTEKQNILAGVTEKVYGKLGTFAQTAGMTQQAFADLFKSDPSAAMLKFFEGLDQVQKAGGDVFGILEKVGITEVRQRDGVLRLAAAHDVLKQSLEDATHAGGAMDKAYQQRAETAAAQFQIFKNQITDVFITLGDAIVPILITVMDAVKPLIDMIAFLAVQFAKLPKPVQMVILVVLALLAAIGPLLILIGLMVPGVMALIIVMPFLVAAFFALLGPISLLMIAIAAFGLALLAFRAYGDTFKNAIIGAFTAVLDFVKTNWKEIGLMIVSPFTAIVAAAGGAFGIKDALIGAFNSVVSTVKGVITGFIAWILQKVSEGIQSIKNIAKYADPRNIPRAVANAAGGAIPHFASGSFSLPRDMLAFVHKGEAIIPANQNPWGKAGASAIGTKGDGGGGTGSAEIAVNGPVKIINTARRQDSKGAFRQIGYGISNGLQRKGLWQ
jgi:hypothetical protein